jgi:hypothetical protein
MNITKKIEEIREQPEHIRLRWVWGCVAFSMFVILAVWIFSVTAMFKKNSDESAPISLPNLDQQIKGLSNQTKSIEDSDSQQMQMDSENQSQVSGLPYNLNNDDLQQAPESSTYSNLQNSQSDDLNSLDNMQQ